MGDAGDLSKIPKNTKNAGDLPHRLGASVTLSNGRYYRMVNRKSVFAWLFSLEIRLYMLPGSGSFIS